jgi:hypothetical protein
MRRRKYESSQDSINILFFLLNVIVLVNGYLIWMRGGVIHMYYHIT